MTVKRNHRQLHSVTQHAPANITMAGTVFKSFIYQESVQQKETIAVPETFLRIKD